MNLHFLACRLLLPVFLAFGGGHFATLPASAAGDLDPLDASIVGSEVYAVAIQPNGQTIITGRFSSVLGLARNNIARLNADGTLDEGFDPNANQVIRSVVVQQDGKVLLGGEFTALQPNGAASPISRRNLARVHADGSLDVDFDPNPNATVFCLALQGDEKILLGGFFNTLQPNGAPSTVPRTRIARVHADGSLDMAFDPGANSAVYCIAVQDDGRILLGGNFTTFRPNGATTNTVRNRAARLLPDGTPEAGFDPKVNSTVFTLVPQPDGKVLIGGDFTWLQPNNILPSTTRNRIARLNADGTLDPGFNPNADSSVFGIALQTDGKVLLGGAFTTLLPTGTVEAIPRNRIARLHTDGTLDMDFDPSANGPVYGVAARMDGKILLGGGFSAFQPNGANAAISRAVFARIVNDNATQEVTVPDASRVFWLRGGAGAELSSVAFELSINNAVHWTPLGKGRRVAGGWELSDLSLPADGQVRARGRTSGGYYNGSGGLIEQVAPFVGLPAVPNIRVLGNSSLILPGDDTPDAADHTDFGGILPATGGITRTFTIRNTGRGDLMLDVLPRVLIGGTHAADFSASMEPASLIGASEATTFQIHFEPGATGPRMATVGIASNDGNKSPYSFAIQGTGFVAPSVGSPTSANLSATTATVGGEVTVDHGIPVIERGVVFSVTATNANPLIGGVGVRKVTTGGGGALGVFTADATDLAPNTHYSFRAYATNRDVTGYSSVAIFDTPPATAGDITPLDAVVVGSSVYATVVQPDGKTIIAGKFSSVLGVARDNIARLNADGTLDMEFDPSANDRVRSVALQPDGKVVLGGFFNSLQPNGAAAPTTRNRIARVNADGTLDPGFDPNVVGVFDAVYCVAVQPDGKVVIGGEFSGLKPNGSAFVTTRERIARVHADGTLDSDFNPKANGVVYCVVPQGDGRLLLGGGFSTLQPNGTAFAAVRRGIARIHADGTLDDGFAPTPHGVVYCVLAQPDGKVLLGGSFTMIQPQGAPQPFTRNHVARVHVDGTLDTDFDPNVEGGSVRSMTLQANGEVLLAGTFLTLRPNGAATATARNHVARLNPDGSLDADFDPNADDLVRSVAVRADGTVLLGGDFTTLQPNNAAIATPRPYLASLVNDPAIQALTVPGVTRISWARSGAAPEVSHAAFDFSADSGASWTSLGDGRRVPGGWELAGLALPGSGIVRALGRTLGGYYNGNSGLIEQSSNFNGLPPAPDLRVFGNDSAIANGDGTPDPGDHTDFGSALPGTGSIARTFTIRNTATADLSLGGTPRIALVGTHPADFSVTRYPDSPVLPSTGTMFEITFAPTSVGPREATVSIVSNDADDSPYIFAIRGTGLGVPVVTSPTSAEITATTARLGGHVMEDNGDTITRRGVVYSPTTTNGDPLVGGAGVTDVTADGTTGSFALPVTGLVPNTGYSFRAYAANGLGTTYTAPVSAFATAAPMVPSVTSPTSAFVDTVAITLGGTVALENGSPIIERGVVYSATVMNDDPLIGGAGVAKVAVGGTTGSFTTILTGFDPGAGYRFKAYAINGLGTGYSSVAAFTPATAGDLDPLDPNLLGSEIRAIAVQPDGKTIIGGTFSVVRGVARSNIARLHGDGTLDLGFDPNVNGGVYCLEVQPDGRIVIGGGFTKLQPNGSPVASARHSIARVNADGTLDPEFDPSAGSAVYDLALQADGKLLLGGAFSSLRPNGAVAFTPRRGIARLHADGTLDTTFDPNPNNNVRRVALQSDGKVLFAGDFSFVRPNGAASSTARSYVARVQADGSLDTGFDPKANNYIYGMAVQADGRVLLGGSFTSLQPNGATTSTSRRYIARLHPDGTLDTAFDPRPSSTVYDMAVQVNGEILLGGNFTTLHPGGVGSPFSRNRIARIHSDGSVDQAFDPNVNDTVRSVTVQADGKVLLGGSFTTIQPQGASSPSTRVCFARLINDEAEQTLAVPSATRVFWARSGTTPEVFPVSFELSADDGVTWSPLGTGTREAGGWKLDNLVLPYGGTIRARGRALGSFTEQVIPFSSTAIDLFVSFMSSHTGLTGMDATAEAVPFNDRVSNVLKYAFNMNLRGPDNHTMDAGGTSGLPSITITGVGPSQSLRIEFVRRIGSRLSYTPMTSPDLSTGSWVPLAVSPVITPIDSQWERVVYLEPFDPTATPVAFCSVDIALP